MTSAPAPTPSGRPRPRPPTARRPTHATDLVRVDYVYIYPAVEGRVYIYPHLHVVEAVKALPRGVLRVLHAQPLHPLRPPPGVHQQPGRVVVPAAGRENSVLHLQPLHPLQPPPGFTSSPSWWENKSEGDPRGGWIHEGRVRGRGFD
eukprot:430469-Pyramimonas_sp.AAC.1